MTPVPSLLAQRLLKVPAPATRQVRVRSLQVPMRDGTVLLADRWAPLTGNEGQPTALLRGNWTRRMAADLDESAAPPVWIAM